MNPGGERQAAGAPEAGLSHLAKRAVQAPVAACLIRAFAREMGEERALAVAAEAVRADAAEAGRAMAVRYRGNTLHELARVVREVWAEGDALTVRMIEATGQSLSFDVTGCRYVDLYNGLGMAELGYCLSCCRDEAFVAGFNPRIRLVRTQTLMEGAPCCDFRFFIE